jgi:PPOX class probable F420-dependent enzyme
MVRRRVANSRVGRLATITAQGDPHIVPVCFAVDDTRIFTAVDHKPKTTTALKRFDNVRSHPRASLLIDFWDEDWSQLWWVRADGRARVLEGGPEFDGALGVLRDKYRTQYGLEGPTGPVIAIDVDRWVGWSAAG